MKVYLQPDTYSRGIVRVADALMQYAPESLELVSDPFDAELEVIHVTGRRDAVQRRIDRLQRKGKPYAMIQYCLRSTQQPNTKQWSKLWEGARCVWSYYDLPELCREDNNGVENPDGAYGFDEPVFNFYYSPLGVDPDVFEETKILQKHFVIMASSQHALSESTRECAFAAKAVNKPMFFLGHELRRGSDIVCKTNIDDETLAFYYSQCEFVSGLRRIEGFEFPVIEGAMCGARPIVFDRPEMRKWYNEFAIFIPEGDREQVLASLTEIFKGKAVPITPAEKKLIAERFDWSKIIKGFWERVL